MWYLLTTRNGPSYALETGGHLSPSTGQSHPLGLQDRSLLEEARVRAAAKWEKLQSDPELVRPALVWMDEQPVPGWRE